MHETEGAYFLMEIDDVDLRLGTSIHDLEEHDYQNGSSSNQLDVIFQYNHQHGTLHMPFLPLNGNPDYKSAVALSEIPAKNRQFPQLNQTQMQFAVMSWFQNGILVSAQRIKEDDVCIEELENWIDKNLEDNERRKGIIEKMHQVAEPFCAPNFKVVMQLGNKFSDNVH
eukprot:TRINITY_DN29429_c0_g3_i1.p2 TRINITY_DN29429_c0_g3~~TRINITY_DN29429_c0_g3_i1.p2  ORF type:complete len:189 (+),score=12.50 TRINITY_DN29429_c0_g3_i1:62-568(+)